MDDYIVSGAGDFDSNNGSFEFIWRRASDSHMGIWWYDPANQFMQFADLGTVDPNWAVLGTSGFAPASAAGTQLLMDYGPTGQMTLWWVARPSPIQPRQLTGINFGPRWASVDFITTSFFGQGPFATHAGGFDFLVTNRSDHHLYDWWIDSNNVLQGFDVGPFWSNVSLVATGRFTPNNGNRTFLVSNNLDHHLYDWWIDSSNNLTGIDLGPYWSNVSLVSDQFFSIAQGADEGCLVTNPADHHLYDWWIANNTLQGLDLGPYWSNVQLVAVGHFDNNFQTAPGNFSYEMLVQNPTDHHLYEWWISAQAQLEGIDLGAYWGNVQLIGHDHYNNASSYDQLLVRNTIDGHFYEWWTVGHTLNGVDIGFAFPSFGVAGSEPAAMTLGDPGSRAGAARGGIDTGASAAVAGSTMAAKAIDPNLPPALPAPSLPTDPSPLLVQAMASFGPSESVNNSAAAGLSTGVVQMSEIATPLDQRLPPG